MDYTGLKQDVLLGYATEADDGGLADDTGILATNSPLPPSAGYYYHHHHHQQHHSAAGITDRHGDMMMVTDSEFAWWAGPGAADDIAAADAATTTTATTTKSENDVQSDAPLAIVKNTLYGLLLLECGHNPTEGLDLPPPTVPEEDDDHSDEEEEGGLTHSERQRNRRDYVLANLVVHRRQVTLQLVDDILAAQVRHVVRMVINKVDEVGPEARGALNAFSSRMRGCLRAAGRGHAVIDHLRRSTNVALTDQLVSEVIQRCAPPTSTRPAASARVFARLYELSRAPGPKQSDLDSMWMRMVPTSQRGLLIEATQQLPGKWLRQFQQARRRS